MPWAYPAVPTGGDTYTLVCVPVRLIPVVGELFNYARVRRLWASPEDWQQGRVFFTKLQRELIENLKCLQAIEDIGVLLAHATGLTDAEQPEVITSYLPAIGARLQEIASNNLDSNGDLQQNVGRWATRGDVASMQGIFPLSNPTRGGQLVTLLDIWQQGSQDIAIAIPGEGDPATLWDLVRDSVGLISDTLDIPSDIADLLQLFLQAGDTLVDTGTDVASIAMSFFNLLSSIINGYALQTLIARANSNKLLLEAQLRQTGGFINPLGDPVTSSDSIMDALRGDATANVTSNVFTLLANIDTNLTSRANELRGDVAGVAGQVQNLDTNTQGSLQLIIARILDTNTHIDDDIVPLIRRVKIALEGENDDATDLLNILDQTSLTLSSIFDNVSLPLRDLISDESENGVTNLFDLLQVMSGQTLDTSGIESRLDALISETQDVEAAISGVSLDTSGIESRLDTNNQYWLDFVSDEETSPNRSMRTLELTIFQVTTLLNELMDTAPPSGRTTLLSLLLELQNIRAGQGNNIDLSTIEGQLLTLIPIAGAIQANTDDIDELEAAINAVRQAITDQTNSLVAIDYCCSKDAPIVPRPPSSGDVVTTDLCKRVQWMIDSVALFHDALNEYSGTVTIGTIQSIYQFATGIQLSQSTAAQMLLYTPIAGNSVSELQEFIEDTRCTVFETSSVSNWATLLIDAVESVFTLAVDDNTSSVLKLALTEAALMNAVWDDNMPPGVDLSAYSNAACQECFGLQQCSIPGTYSIQSTSGSVIVYFDGTPGIQTWTGNLDGLTPDRLLDINCIRANGWKLFVTSTEDTGYQWVGVSDRSSVNPLDAGVRTDMTLEAGFDQAQNLALTIRGRGGGGSGPQTTVVIEIIDPFA